MKPLSYTSKPITDVFTADTDIDRRKCRRIVPMKVLALGLGRTGTVSLRLALKHLGFEDTYHMMSASVENPPDCLMWQEALMAKYDGVGTFGSEKWDQLLGHCQAVCDWPAIAFAKELIETYPDAKVILTTRDVESWYTSTMKTVHWRVHDHELKMISRWDWGARLYRPMLIKFWDAFFGDFEKNGKKRFHEHYREVKSLVEPGRLLEYHISEGWGPLCGFLGLEAPKDIPFPHANDAIGFVERCQRRNRAQMYNVALKFLIIASGIMALVSIFLLSSEKR